LQGDTSDDAAIDEDELAVVMLKLARTMGEPLSETQQGLHLRDTAETVARFGADGSLRFRDFANMLCHSPWRRILSGEVQAAIGPMAIEMFEPPGAQHSGGSDCP
jgi:hypothetical protein